MAYTRLGATGLQVSKPGHVEDAVAALDIELSDDETAALEASYVAHPALGHG